MNQKVVIYIILSAILLYLYYKKQDLAVFVAFAVVAGSTLIFRSATIGEEGFSGGGGDKDCAKMGFKPIKLDKKDTEGSLEKVLKTIKTVANKQWPYDNMGGKTTDEDKEKAFATFIKEFQEDVKERTDKERKTIDLFVIISANAYEKGNMYELLKELEKPGQLGDIINGGKLTLKVLEKLSKSTKTSSDFKKTIKYLICLCSYWTTMYQAIQKILKANSAGGDGDGGDEGDDEEAKPKKKKNKSTKKKSKKDDADDDNDEE
jgi:hypothetical protein